MPYIALNSAEPGIRGLLRYRPETGRPLSELAEVLLAIAAAVRQGGLNVTAELVAQARTEDATDLEIHDTVLIAAVFCMFNRYVDGLATIVPDDPALYAAGAQRLIQDGYLPPPDEPGLRD